MACHLCEKQAAIVAVLDGKCNLHHLEVSSREWYILESLDQAELVWYKAEPQLPHDHDSLLWWLDRTSSYPLLGRLSRKYLCLPSTSVLSESLFGISGAVVNEKRSSFGSL